MFFKHQNKPFLTIFALLLFPSCISMEKLNNKYPTPIEDFSLEKFNGNYANSSLDTSDVKLWKILRECKTLEQDTTTFTANTVIRLNYNGRGLLTVKAMEGSRIVNQFDLKCKIKNNYISIKRYLYLIPFPFAYYRHSERKVIIGILPNGEIVVKHGFEEFVWLVIMAGGNDGLLKSIYKKH